jgi:hypothetical protein
MMQGDVHCTVESDDGETAGDTRLRTTVEGDVAIEGIDGADRAGKLA